MWSFGTLGLLNYEITVLTAIIPPLIIVIGTPNCIFLINKYQSEIKIHGNKAKSLQRVISKSRKFYFDDEFNYGCWFWNLHFHG